MLPSIFVNLMFLATFLGSVMAHTSFQNDGTVPSKTALFYDYEKRSIPIPADIPRAGQILNSIFTRFHSFINETNFDNRRFALEYDSLADNIIRAAVLIGRIREPEHPFPRLMRFAEQMLRVMRAAQQNMDRAELLFGSGPYFCLLYDASELRVMTMDMFNDRVVLTMSAREFQDRVRGFLRRSAELEIEFHSFPFIPLSVRMCTWNDIMHANQMLQMLQSRPHP